MMNLIDRTIAWFSPAAGFRRVRARLALGNVAHFGFDGAKTGRRMQGWLTSGADANTELSGTLQRLRDRSRDLVRNNYLAARAAGVWQTKIVGTGIQARWKSEKLQEQWDAWSQQCSADQLPSFDAVLALVCRTVFESGECFIRFRQRPLADGLPVPFQLQVLEPDYIDHARSGPAYGSEGKQSGYIIQGIEYDLIGQVQAYWMFGQHPGASVITGARNGATLTAARVPADQVLHIREQLRPGQVHGYPKLAPVIARMRDLDDWEDAEIVRKKTEACLAAFIFNPNDDAMAPQVTDSSGQVVESFQPGMLARVSPGNDIKFNTPQYAGGYADYKRSVARDIAAGTEIPYEILTGDFSQSNYSSSRLGLVAFRDVIEFQQWNVYIPLVCAPVAARFWAQLDMLLGGAPLEAPEWHPPAFALLDRTEESKGDMLMLANGTMTWPQAVARQGYDPEKQIAEIEAWRDRLAAAGVTYSSNPQAGKQNGNSGSQPAAD